jgi:hypothetical protein
MKFLKQRLFKAAPRYGIQAFYDAMKWDVIGPEEFRDLPSGNVTLFLHQANPLAELLELHVVLSSWSAGARNA